MTRKDRKVLLEIKDVSLSFGGVAALSGISLQVRECVEKVNADLARDRRLSGSQIRRFLIPRKELDADDGELTRTRKVRRGFIAEKYSELIEALRSASGLSCSSR